ncbi:hypothetical protein AV274_4403 [Blastocystis sp. ATCC 50177/Nand II]|uniref:Uncharacterized protein n=1 Tax=Blastocystis sp. subtype 1 (strain ATCC 50177 / NandII) TaxID=478820 RepID=A0A196SD24_BLAHN|nr:hypothetical protein AV274_4403 [Blastocystis sp. ATCC 50177/Nand II]
MEDKAQQTTIEEDIRDLEKTEEQLLHVLEIVKQLTEELSNTDLPTEERISASKKLTIDYMKTVDAICDSLKKHTELMDYYREAYRIDNTAWLGESMNHLAASSTKPEEAVNIDLSHKAT